MPTFKSVAIDEATAAQRFKYATSILNLELDEADSDEQVIAQIRQAQPQSQMIFVEDEGEPEVERQVPTDLSETLHEQATGIQGTRGSSDPRAVIRIAITERPDGGKEDVAVGVNGFVWQLKRGVDIEVPWRVVEALRNAIETNITHDARPEHEGEVISNEVDRIPFSIISGPSQAEIAEWKSRVGSKFCP